MKLKKYLSLLLCLCLALALLPAAALAVDAAVRYLDIETDEDGNPTSCTYLDNAANADGMLIENGAYAFQSAYEGVLIVSNATVTYTGDADLSRFGSSIYVFGSGSFSADNVTVTKGGYNGSYAGTTGEALSEFIGGLRDGDTDYSYTFKKDKTLENFFTAYDLTIQADKTLTVGAPQAGEGQPEFYRLSVTHSLTVNGTLTAAAGQLLQIGQNASVSGLTLYGDDGATEYVLENEHSAEEFCYTDGKWVRQSPGGGGSGGDEPGGGQTAPAVSFRVQNPSADVGAVTYRINDGDWTDAALTLSGEEPNQHLSGTITGTLAADDTISIKAAPAEGYELDSGRGVVVWIDDSQTTLSDGAAALVSTDGLSYTLRENASYEFEFGFQPVNNPGGEPGGDEPGGDEPGGDDPDVDVPPAEAPDYAAAKARLESRHWAFGGAAAAVEDGFKAELWDLLRHEFPGMFVNRTACDAAVTAFSENTTASETEIAGVSYYTATVTLDTDNSAAIRVYALPDTSTCVVRFGQTFLMLNANTPSTAACKVTTRTQGGAAALTDVQLSIDSAETADVEIFGNGVMANTMASSDSHAVWHVTPPPSLKGLSSLNFILAVYEEGFRGAKITASGDGGTAAAWDSMGQYPIAPLNEAGEWNVFFGDTSVTIDSAAFTALGTVTGVALASGTPAAAAEIRGTGPWTVTFGSAFFDTIPLRITVGETAYELTIRRVGIDIQGIGRDGEALSCTVNHGTQPGSTLVWDSGDQYAVVATFYYPFAMLTGPSPADRVSLAVNYVYPGGRTETKLVTAPELTVDDSGHFIPADDFILYKGTREGAPAGVYVTAILHSSDAAFGGAKLGSGAGVAWTNAK